MVTCRMVCGLMRCSGQAPAVSAPQLPCQLPAGPNLHIHHSRWVFAYSHCSIQYKPKHLFQARDDRKSVKEDPCKRMPLLPKSGMLHLQQGCLSWVDDRPPIQDYYVIWLQACTTWCPQHAVGSCEDLSWLNMQTLIHKRQTHHHPA